LKALQAIKDGFQAGIEGIFQSAAPCLDLLSHWDWRVLLCGQENVNAAQIISVLSFEGEEGKQSWQFQVVVRLV